MDRQPDAAGRRGSDCPGLAGEFSPDLFDRQPGSPVARIPGASVLQAIPGRDANSWRRRRSEGCHQHPGIAPGVRWIGQVLRGKDSRKHLTADCADKRRSSQKISYPKLLFADGVRHTRQIPPLTVTQAVSP